MSDSKISLQAGLGIGVLATVAGTFFAARDALDWSEWGPPLVVFGGAVVGGIGLAVTMGRDDAEAAAVEAAGHREDLERRRTDALEALAALETQKPQMDPEDYQAERKALLARGAEAMRELESGQASAPSPSQDSLAEGVQRLTAALQRGEIDEVTYAKAVAALSTAQSAAAPAPTAPAPTPASPPPAKQEGLAPQWIGAIYTAVGVAVVGGLLYFVQNDAQPRREGAGMTGNQELSSSQSPPASAEPAFLAAAKEKAQLDLAANPNDLTALNTLTQLNFSTPAEAWKYNEQARKIAPDDADALVYEAVITTIMGMPDKAQAKFDAVLAKHPEHGAGWAYKGLTLMEGKRFAEAVEPLEKAISLGIQDRDIMSALAVAKNGGKAPAMGAPGGPSAAPPHPPGGPSPHGSSAVIAGGTLDIDPGRSSFKAQVIFVSVKDPAMPGPPLASVRLPPGPFPMTFQITEADKIPMMGNRPVPENVILSVRMDDDGNATTRSPSDPQVVIEKLSKGSKDLTLTLK